MFIIFIGVSGSGKTTIGKMTAEALGVPYTSKAMTIIPRRMSIKCPGASP